MNTSIKDCVVVAKDVHSCYSISRWYSVSSLYSARVVSKWPTTFQGYTRDR